MKDLDEFISYYWDEINHNINTHQNAGIYQDDDGNYHVYNSDELQELINKLV